MSVSELQSISRAEPVGTLRLESQPIPADPASDDVPFAKTPVVSSTKAVPASGVGDDAVYAVSVDASGYSAAQLFVKKGSTYFVVHVPGFPDQTKAMAIEKTLALQACSKL